MNLDPGTLEIIINLGAAWLAGSLIGLERSVHARPAGFRTHALVCLASALLMIVTTHQWEWIGEWPLETLRTDPTRMVQGIMTGIGFLGAGVIFKEGLTVHGLTTAASIWVTAALGVLFGVGFFLPAVLGTLAVIGTLGFFRWVESHIPVEFYAHHTVKFANGQVLPEADLRTLLERYGFAISNLSYSKDDNGESFEYEMMITGPARRARIEELVETLRDRKDVLEFRITPMGD
jgi:putative Mg2+ transporter-C (MgtC) family protein